MFKFLFYIFLIQLVHWSSVVSGEEPTAFGTTKAAIVNALKTAVAGDPSPASGSCTTKEEADAVLTPCLAPLNSLTTAANPVDAVVKATGATYYFYQSLLEKNSDFTDTVLDEVCKGIKKTESCMESCSAEASGKLAVAKIKAQYNIYNYWRIFCILTPLGRKSSFTNPFKADTNKYTVCKGTSSGIRLEAAFLDAVNYINGLSALADLDDRIALINNRNAEKTVMLKSLCYNIQTTYNKVLLVYYQEKSKFTADCDENTVTLWFYLIKAVIPPGIDLACQLDDPHDTIPPEINPRDSLVYFGFQHIRYRKLASAEAAKFASCKDTDPTTNPLLFSYPGIMIEGGFDVTLHPQFPFLNKVKVTLMSGNNNFTYEISADKNNLPTQFKNAAGADSGNYFGKVFLITGNSNATITDPATGIFIIINKVVTDSSAIYGVTVSAPKSVLDLLNGGSMYGGCTKELNTAVGTAGFATLEEAKTFDNGKMTGSDSLVDQVGLAIIESFTLPEPPTRITTNPADCSSYMQASLPLVLLSAVIAKMMRM